MAVPVHNHTYYSALDGFSKPEEIAARVSELGMQGAFLTDHGTVAGWDQFAKEMKKKDLLVGYGIEAYQAPNSRTERGNGIKRSEASYHLILLAETKTGYLNLKRLSDEANKTGFYYVPRTDWELLEKYSEGVIATSACLGSLICHGLREGFDDHDALNKTLQIFKDKFYIELHTYDNPQQEKMNGKLVDIAQERGIPMIYANDAHYTYRDQFELHEAFLCAQMGTWLDADKSKKFAAGAQNSNPLRFHEQCLYIYDEDEVAEALDYLDDDVIVEAVENTDALLEKCQFELEPHSLHLPRAKRDDKGKQSNRDYLIERVEEGMLRLYGGEDEFPEAWERAAFELESIIGAGLGDYFLIVDDYVNHSLKQGYLVGPGRGSVGGSIIAYALGITVIDPLKYHLQFERFWNPGRAEGLPDVDIDFPRTGRQEGIDYVTKKYGFVLPIGNHVFLWPKSAIDKAGQVRYERPPYGAMKKIKDIMESTTDAGKLMSWDEMMKEVGEELAVYEAEFPELFQTAKEFSGRLSTYGVHASAVVISDVDLAEHLPARLASDPEKDKVKVLVSQAEMHQVEDMGFPKFDFLGLRNLDTIMRAAELSDRFK